jgi:hypothetical protein
MRAYKTVFGYLRLASESRFYSRQCKDTLYVVSNGGLGMGKANVSLLVAESPRWLFLFARPSNLSLATA